MRTLSRIALAVGILLPVLPRPVRADDADDAKIRKSVVKISVSMRQPDPFRPWTRGATHEATGSGVVIAGKRILTNSHMVNHASQVYVQPDKSSEKLTASVVARAPGIDLAVLKLDDESFFQDHPALPTNSRLPDLKQTIFAYGFPTGGSELSITRGIVSRIEYADYYMGDKGLRIQVDAAVNPGNSGGPAVVDGQLIGVVFSRLQQADNIGYIIPMEEIDLFLKDIQDGRYDGKPILDIDVQSMENPTLRVRYKLEKRTTGVLVRKVHLGDPSYPLHVGDVLTRIGDHAIDNAGMVHVEADRMIKFNYLVQRLARDGRLPIILVRDGKEIRLDLPVKPRAPRLFPGSIEQPLAYFILGPLAFTEATEDYINYLAMMYSRSGPDTDGKASQRPGALTILYQANPMFTRYSDRPAFPGERIVIVPHPMFTHKMSKGYEDPYADAVAEVNGIHVRNLKHLVEVIRDATGEYLEFTFQGRATYTLVFKRQEALDATDEVLSDNGIRQQCSPDIAPIWNEGKKKAK
jgi:S1-C subfamily serine protease